MTLPEASNHAVYFVPGLQRGLKVLETLGASEGALSLSEIGRVLGISRSSAFRLVYTLRQMGFIKEAEQKNTYTLGARVLNLGFAYLNQQPIATIARPHLATLRDKVNISAHLSVLESQDVLYLGSHQARAGYVSNMVTGTRQKAYASAIGWCLLSDLTDDEIRQFCMGQDMVPFTEHTPTNPEMLIARIKDIVATGYVYSRGFREPGGSSIATPVRDARGRIVACVNISGPDGAFDTSKIKGFYWPAVAETALQISRELGYLGKG